MATITKDTRFRVKNGNIWTVILCLGETSVIKNGKIVAIRIVDGKPSGPSRQFDAATLDIIHEDPKAQLRAFHELSRQKREARRAAK